jgi:hypothetical protein
LSPTNLAGLHITNQINKANSNATGSTASTGGMSDLYAKASTIAYWQPTTVDGYPAAFGDAISDGRAQGDCVINVGVNDHLAFFAGYDNPDNVSQACALAHRARRIPSTGVDGEQRFGTEERTAPPVIGETPTEREQRHAQDAGRHHRDQ